MYFPFHRDQICKFCNALPSIPFQSLIRFGKRNFCSSVRIIVTAPETIFL